MASAKLPLESILLPLTPAAAEGATVLPQPLAANCAANMSCSCLICSAAMAAANSIGFCISGCCCCCACGGACCCSGNACCCCGCSCCCRGIAADCSVGGGGPRTTFCTKNLWPGGCNCV